MRLLSFLLLPLLATSTTLAQPDTDRLYAVDELRQDLAYVRARLEKRHPNLYLYTPKPVMDSVFQALDAGLKVPMDARTFYKYVNAIQPWIRDGHNFILPSSATQAWYPAHAGYFPLDLVQLDGRVYITRNLSDESGLQPGDEILSIDDQSASEVFNELVRHQVRDGDNLHYPSFLSATFFRSFYGFMHGFPDAHAVDIAHRSGKRALYTLKALPLDTLSARRARIARSFNQHLYAPEGISWRLDTHARLAILDIRSWSNELLKENYGEKFKRAIDRFLAELRASGARHLIIDLRGNQGGEGRNGIRLARHLLDAPFVYFPDVLAYNRKGRLVSQGGFLTKINKPARDPFRGSIHILVDGGSFSNSPSFCAVFRTAGRATMVGTETGGNHAVLAGGNGYGTLPNTRLRLLDATHRMITAGRPPNEGRGLHPDHVVTSSHEDVISGHDAVMEAAIRMATGQQQ